MWRMNASRMVRHRRTLRLLGALRYTALGETRYSDGTTPTKRHFQGQVEEIALTDMEIGE
jgi:hypothetical protein